MLAHTGEVSVHWHAVVGALLTDPELDARLREIVILRVAYLTGSSYERLHHEEIAARAGVPADVIAELARAEPRPAAFNATQNAVLALVDALVRGHHADEGTFKAVHERVGTEVTAKLVLLIGVYVSTAVFLNAFEVDMDAGARLGVIAPT
ncbi:carboxymuconolactone decarboxylase family protein [Actinomadura sp. 9N215]|uniref:carboxymuconolactone decarboxylase family protein n=1 Tax=Actinomadura sp. 9N215 TaxID=3375150 RepID=UPI0037921FC8